MTIANIAFDFTPLGRNARNQSRTAVSGMTMTVYDTRFSVTDAVLNALDDPERISITYNPELESFLVFADEEGHLVGNRTGSGKQFSERDVRNILTEVKNCDFVTNFYRIQNGRRFGKFVLFSTDDLIEIRREERNGKH